MINNRPKGIKIDPLRLQQNTAKSEPPRITPPKKPKDTK